MKIRQEPLVFAGSVVLLGLLGWGLFGRGAGTLRGAGSKASSADLAHFHAPDPTVALPSTSVPPLARELFAPPSDTSPLPPLPLIEPPRERLPALLPPTDPGPAPAAYGKLLRRELPTVDLPDLFARAGETPQEVEDEAFFQLGGRAADKPALVPGGDKKPVDPHADESPAERTARIAAYKRRYDWVQRGPGDLWFGRIENDDRYGLEVDAARASEALLFLRLDPDSGRDFYGNIRAAPLPVERASIGAFGFADTVSNQIELRARKIGTELTRGTFVEALALARHCIEVRLEAPRALAIAEELYRRAAAYDAKDPEPRLGLARCYEAAFRFEDAYAQYQELLEAFGHREEVHVRLAGLEERLLLFKPAEQRLRDALAMNQGSWVTRFGLGGFLARRGRFAEAVEHLKVANQNAPQDPELLPVRVAIRTTLADAHLALGELAEAEAAYRAALQADAGHQRALAGLVAVQTLANKPTEQVAAGDAGFELLLATGVRAIADGQHEAARDALRLAVDADPLRGHRALTALSVLAEITGNGEEALRLADEALERDPTYAFALFQKGRLLGRQDDYEGARAALLAALEQELDFEDALVALGDVAFRLGRFEDAERYLERAVNLRNDRPEVHALRGLNLLRLASVGPARASFERALEIAPEEPTALAGRAWCIYLEGNPEEALIQIASIDERRRKLPEDDPWRVWSREQITRLQEHLQKVEWRDPLDRKRLANGWLTREASGPTVSMADGAVRIQGSFTKEGDARVYRMYQGGEFLSFEADVRIDPVNGAADALVGIFAARERQRRDDSEILAEASVARHKEGNVQLRFQRTGQPEELHDMRQSFPLGQWVRLKLERTGESADAAVTLYMDGIPLMERVSMPSLVQTNSPLLVGLFAEGATGRPVDVRMDNVAIVTRVAP